MSQDIYALTSHELIIQDLELNIALKLPFDLPRLSADLKGTRHVHDRDAKGQLLSVYLVDSGKRHGECRLYGEEDKVRAEMFYLHGKLHGPSIMYGDQGEILARTWYCEGKRVGKAQFYYPSGTLSSLQRFKEGEWHGTQEYFYENGNVKSRLPFVKGKLHGEVCLFWESGLMKRSAQYVDGLREGFDKLWNEHGILIDEGEYRAGQPVGTHRHFFSNGNVKEELHYHNSLRFDRREWNASGKLIFEGVYAPDLSYTERTFLEPHGAKVRKGVWDVNRIRWK